MAFTSGAIAAAGLAVAAVGTGASIYMGVQAAKEGKKARKLEQGRQQNEEKRRRRQEIRQARIRRATTLNAGVQVGGTDSSALQGGLGSLQSQLSSSIGFGNQQAFFNNKISSTLQKQQGFIDKGNIASGIAGLGSLGFSAAGGSSAISEAFFSGGGAFSKAGGGSSFNKSF